MNIISKFILSPKEIETILGELVSQGLEMQGLDDASNYLSTTVLHKGSSLIISVNIPRVLPQSYRKVIIEPLPLSNRTIKLTYQTVFINQERILAITSKCRENNKITLCQRRQLVDINDDPCLAPLLRGHHGQCPQSEKPPSTEIKTIAPGTLLVVTVHQDVPINSTCDISTKSLTGIHLITFHNCSIYIKNELYENYELWFDHPTILPLQPRKIIPLQINRHINISELQELNLKNRRQLETMDLTYKIGLSSLSTFVIIISAALALGILKYRQLAKSNCSGRAILMGEAIKHEPTVPSITGANTAPRAVQLIETDTAKSASTLIATDGQSMATSAATCFNTKRAGSARTPLETIGRLVTTHRLT